ncbi:hypothetical protein TI39_contig415g00011 [Zymoseptoria brevis]|uniref:WW domain-containing protein n=1 Tax=Zymoseptoria brevis TaxID=1047168 RepID=A0A0F4GMS8_9PEZI|nr:hypothetical protein TI39_contig415g00011 [Zymoseptoria brevis]
MADNSQKPVDRSHRSASENLPVSDGSRTVGATRSCNVTVDLPVTRSPLPPHWEELSNSEGRTYYANYATRTTSWQRPVHSPDSGLPVAWQELTDDEGQTYYANHALRATTLERPENPVGELPAGWEILRNAQGVACFADHNTHTATWNDPRAL